MRQLTAALETAQKQAARSPCVQVRITNTCAGVIRADWSRLYNGTENDQIHSACMPGDGSLVRVRVTPVSDSRKLYLQRVINPCPGSDFSQWVNTGQTDVLAAAAASKGLDASIVWIKSNREIWSMKSTDYGANWGSPELLDYSPSTSVYGIAAAYKNNGDLAIFFADQAVLYVKKCLSGQWQAKTAWDKSTGNLSGVACIYDGDWNLLVTGVDTSGNFKLWSLVYGDGGEVASGTWSLLHEAATAPAAGDYDYKQPFLGKTDVYRGSFVEVFSGIESYTRPFFTNIVPGTSYKDGIWNEPVPFNLASEFGLAMNHSGGYAWLTCASGIWRSPVTIEFLDISSDVKKAGQVSGKTGGDLTVEISNENGRYLAAGQGDLAVLAPGYDIEFNPGYITAQGAEYSAGQYYLIESLELSSGGGKASVNLQATDGWRRLEKWRARCQFRWNKSGDSVCLKDILAMVLGRAGLKLIVKSCSSTATGFYPDFSINPGSTGRDTVLKLLSYMPDQLFFEGNTAYLVNPQSSDSPVYSYGAGHDIIDSRFLKRHGNLNRVQVEGWDVSAGERIIVDSFAWDEVYRFGDCFQHISDRNIGTVVEAGQRGGAVLRKMEMEAETGWMIIPVNCGQQLYDVIAITDSGIGFEEAARRIAGIALIYNPARGEYTQRLELMKV